MRPSIFAFLLLLLGAAGSFALTVDAPLADPAAEARARALFTELRCVVCAGESIAESSAEVAGDIRTQVRRMIGDGAADAEITAFLVSRYGAVVRMRPPLAPNTWLLWIGPLLALALGGAVVAAYFGTSRITKR